MMKRRKVILQVLCAAALLFAFTACGQQGGTGEQTSAEPEEAILKFLSEDQDVQATRDELDEMIFGSFPGEEEGSQYYLLKKTQEIKGELNYDAYIAKVIQEKDGSYRCEKATPDFSLGAVDEKIEAGNDQDPYTGWGIQVDDHLWVYAGRMLDSDYEPYFEGKKLETDQDGFFFYYTKQEGAELEVKEK